MQASCYMNTALKYINYLPLGVQLGTIYQAFMFYKRELFLLCRCCMNANETNNQAPKLFGSVFQMRYTSYVYLAMSVFLGCVPALSWSDKLSPFQLIFIICTYTAQYLHHCPRLEEWALLQTCLTCKILYLPFQSREAVVQLLSLLYVGPFFLARLNCFIFL